MGRTPFETLVAERGWQRFSVFRRRYEDAARTLADRLRRPEMRTATISARQFARWLRGDVESAPRNDARLILEHLFEMPVEQLLGTAPPGKDVAETAIASSVFDARMQEDAVTSAARDSARFAARAERSNVGPHTLDQIRADIVRILATYPNRPVEPLFWEVKEIRDRTFELLEGRQPPAYTRDLYLAAGVLCGILANASFDLGRLVAAETQARAGFLCAELAGHNGLRAWLRGLQALMAYWDGRGEDAVRLAETGLDFPPEGGTAGVRLASIAARAYGQLGMHAEAQNALRLAEELRERVTEDGDLGGMMEFPHEKQLLYASTTLLWQGDAQAVQQAEGHAEDAVRLYESAQPGERRVGELSLARLDLARSRLMSSDVEGAADQVHTVLGIATRRRTESVTRCLDRFARDLAGAPAGASRVALGVQEAIEAHRRRAPRMLPGGHQ
ncbi:hypothetical protein [Streptomyces litchfieldiae]|uniref:Uncharacterized protein n=1 Tax=Streptomyces litchfieldiae TaxID=3075543 RepID=A0ABU2MN70_9ACTN|nr:hypothetical protein [Streptomyces sp. DSM 44938]MDT0343068.1 hypothetical protein [Streptomyces sp. DSM 44938]